MRRPRALVAPFVLIGLILPCAAHAQEERSPGLPFADRIDWTFHFDAGLGVFGFNNSLYTNPRPDPSGDLSDNWWEGFAKPGISASYEFEGGELYGTASVAGERTFGVSPDLVGGDANSYGFEEANIGWRSGDALSGLGEDALDFTFGRAQYNLGTGFLLWDGAGEGGSRGGYWSNARKAFELAGIGRLNTGAHRLEAFYLDRDETPEGDTGSELWGANYELTLFDRLTLGATYMGWSAIDSLAPERDGLSVYDFRVSATPVPSVPITIDGEYAIESNGDLLDSTGWYLQASYPFESVGWTPTPYYRYASFQGDDPETDANEAFDSLFPGFYDWGTWWQGEIAGEYFLGNSNLLSHMFRVHASPSGSVGTGLIYFIFTADEPAAYCGEEGCATEDDLAFELDFYLDWSINDNFLVSFVGAWATPGDAIEQAFGRVDDFTYGMIYMAYSF
ncbi:MAG: hypothetical protein R3195_02430 [Gemmatimonadota bacterium]|nr:hypothetical protein [Gemmatimonadota bacterium]